MEQREGDVLHAAAHRFGILPRVFLAGATNDFFYWPRAVQATLDAIPGEKNHLYAPNANHRVALPGGSVFPEAEPFTPTPFQPIPTPSGDKANWMAMEVPFFDYYLKGVGDPLPKVRVQPGSDRLTARFTVAAPHSLTKVEVYWAKSNSDVMKREWIGVPATLSGGVYEFRLPSEAAEWFALVSDDRPVTVSSDLVTVRGPAATRRSGMPPGTPLYLPPSTERSSRIEPPSP